ncbi:class I SAM-dependent methyltransferase [Actinocatenispora thailandica]|nr:class I SAM-dependent methyltransferase [Actinocatenispora thailandica]
MEPEIRDSHRLSFGPAADLYDEVRPTYPAAAIGWMVGPAPRRVVDLGAGTGIFTRQLVAAGHQVIAVEPDPGMRARLASRVPGAATPAGSAESVPVPDASVDAVVAAQSYHWFDPAVAHPEIARVLVPGGVFAPIWNHRDTGVDWVAQLSGIVGGEDVIPPELPDELFGPVQRADFRHEVPSSPDLLVALISSRSHYLTAAPAERDRLEREVRQLCATHPDLRGRDRFPMPYLTSAFRAARR